MCACACTHTLVTFKRYNGIKDEKLRYFGHPLKNPTIFLGGSSWKTNIEGGYPNILCFWGDRGGIPWCALCKKELTFKEESQTWFKFYHVKPIRSWKTSVEGWLHGLLPQTSYCWGLQHPETPHFQSRKRDLPKINFLDFPEVIANQSWRSSHLPMRWGLHPAGHQTCISKSL